MKCKTKLPARDSFPLRATLFCAHARRGHASPCSVSRGWPCRPCASRRRAMRRPSAYFAASIRVLSAEYNPESRPAVSVFLQCVGASGACVSLSGCCRSLPCAGTQKGPHRRVVRPVQPFVGVLNLSASLLDALVAIHGQVAQFLFDAEQLVVFGHAVGAA